MTTLAFAALLGLAGMDEIKVELKDGKFTAANSEHVGFNEGDNRVFFYGKGKAEFEFEAPADGEYKLVLEMACDPAMDKFAQVKVMGGKTVVKEKFDLTQGDVKEYEFTVTVKKGKSTISVEFLNDLYKEGEYDMNLFLHSAKLVKKAAPAAAPPAAAPKN